MTAAATFSLPRLNYSFISVMAISVLIAWSGPFDVVIDAATFGQPVLRMMLLLVLVCIGAACAQRCRLHIEGTGTARPILAGAVLAGIVGVYIVIVDAFLFRPTLAPDYVNIFHAISLNHRLTYYFMRAYQESVIYRLFLFSVVIYALTILQHRAPSLWQICIVSIGVQGLNVALNQIPLEPFSAQMLLYDVIRYGVPGSLWGWVYWRFGFSPLEVAHVGSHVIIQPALGVLI